MSKPESTGAKSLEEILASIRKSLADEGSERPPEPRAPTLKAAQPQLQPAAPEAGAPAKPASAPIKGASVLTAKLAGAANGASRGSSLDSDLSELLAGEPSKTAPPAPGEASKPAGAAAGGDEDKDPLWFLSRLSAAAAGPAGQGSAARARDAAKAPTPAEDITLSRPETLRASFPPLFDSTAEPAPTVAKGDKSDRGGKPDAASGLTARTQPRVLTPHLDPAPANETPEAFKGLGKAEPAASTYSAFGAFAPSALREEPAAHTAPAQPAVVSDKPALAEAATPASPIEAKPPATAATHELRPELGLGRASDSAPAATGDALPTRALEQMVAELLEPVIRQWLNNNLPRLIEKAVREEVARVVAAEREAKKA